MTQRRKVSLDFGTVGKMGANTGQLLCRLLITAWMSFAPGSNKDSLSPHEVRGTGLRTQNYAAALTVDFNHLLLLEVTKHSQ